MATIVEDYNYASKFLHSGKTHLLLDKKKVFEFDFLEDLSFTMNNKILYSPVATFFKPDGFIYNGQNMPHVYWGLMDDDKKLPQKCNPDPLIINVKGLIFPPEVKENTVFDARYWHSIIKLDEIRLNNMFITLKCPLGNYEYLSVENVKVGLNKVTLNLEVELTLIQIRFEHLHPQAKPGNSIKHPFPNPEREKKFDKLTTEAHTKIQDKAKAKELKRKNGMLLNENLINKFNNNPDGHF